MKHANSALCVCSAHPRAGKTALALAIGLRLMRAGAAVGYWKPVSPDEADAIIAGHMLDIARDSIPRPLTESSQSSKEMSGAGILMAESLARSATMADVLLLEIACSQGEVELTMLIEALHGAGISPKALFLARYGDGDLVEEIVRAQGAFGATFAGAIINGVPAEHEWYVTDRVLSTLAGREVDVFGVLPQERSLATPSVRELITRLGAAILVTGGEDALEKSFESVMFGSMSAEDGQRYFNRRQDKLVVTRGDRPDVHMAALGTSTRCLLLAGGYPSYPFVLDRAEQLGIPVISVTTDISTTVERVSGILSESSKITATKLRGFEELLWTHVDWRRMAAAALPEISLQ